MSTSHITKSRAPTKPLRFYDGAGWTCDVQIPLAHWELFKREARRAHMRTRDFLIKVIEDYCNLVLEESADT